MAQTYDAFLSEDIFKRLPGGELKILRIVSIYERPFSPESDEVEEIIINAGGSNEEGGVTRSNDKQVAEDVVDNLEELGYTVKAGNEKTFQTLTAEETAVLSGSFELRKNKTEGEK